MSQPPAQENSIHQKIFSVLQNPFGYNPLFKDVTKVSDNNFYRCVISTNVWISYPWKRNNETATLRLKY